MGVSILVMQINLHAQSDLLHHSPLEGMCASNLLLVGIGIDTFRKHVRRQAQNLPASARPRAQVRARCVLSFLNLFYACQRMGGDIANTLQQISHPNRSRESKESKEFRGRQQMHPQGLLSVSVTARRDRRMMLL